jgi:hypothetical protein
MAKSRIPAAVAVSMCLLVVESMRSSSVTAAVDRDALTTAIPNLSGTFANRSYAAHCRIGSPKASDAELRVIQISQRRDSLRLRSAGISGIRVIPIEVRRHAGLAPVGVGRWEGTALVVHTGPPSAPMWLDVVPSIAGLVEKFEIVEGTKLQYDAWYTPTGAFSAERPFSLSLTRCSNRGSY